MYASWEIVGYGVGAGFGVVVFLYLCLYCLGFTCMGVREVPAPPSVRAASGTSRREAASRAARVPEQGD
ncbi:hypothetical protein CEXT_745511 [Caerostris extrusa]|uniref:Uncharacterized protein n=1 Tax=Caerostris extrusa TaxID=172846 RepID=A0AAV4P3E4_CAEEX|nr:hypothetical protein CEXT_745511 [Caerostris extrusa]